MANKTGHKAPLTYANIVRIVPHQAAQPPQRKQSVSRSRPEQTQEVTRSDGVLSHSANEGRSEEGLDAKGNKRRQLKQDHKKEKDMIYEDARAQGGKTQGSLSLSTRALI